VAMLFENLVACLLAWPRQRAAPLFCSFSSFYSPQDMLTNFVLCSYRPYRSWATQHLILYLRVGGKYQLGKKIGSGSFGTL
jgi:hypothetical protein